MKIINELSAAQIKNNKKDTLATKLSIFLAVVLLGTIVFILGSINADEYEKICSMVGNYNVSITDVNSDMIETLFDDQDIEKLSFDKYILTDLNAVIVEKGAYYQELEGYDVISGRQPNSEGEIIVPTRFLANHKDYKIGSIISVNDKEYTIVGDYDDWAMTFDESMFIGYLSDESKDHLLENTDGLEVYIWYKNPRDTYTLTKKLLQKFNMDYSKSLDTGRLYFNKDILEHDLIYPSGIIPPGHVIKKTVETYGVCIFLVFLFSIMVYGAFNVWNNRDLKELALLKSVGMTEKQVKKMIRLKVLRIGVIPIMLGTAISYVIANLLLYLMWFNNSVSYKNFSNILGEELKAADFHLIKLSAPIILTILVLAFLTVYLSAIMPARKSAKLNVIEGLTGIANQKVKYSKSKITGKIEKTLATDYFKAYSLTYRTIIMTILLSAMAMNFVLISQAYRTVDAKYGKFDSPYNITSHIYTSDYLNKQLITDLTVVDGVDELHVYLNKNFKFYLNDNEGFESEELKRAFDAGDKYAKHIYVNMVGLTDDDFNYVISSNGLGRDSEYILLNKIPENDVSPYYFRNYIPVTDKQNKELYLRYNADETKMPIRIDGYIDDFPFSLEGQDENAVYVLTRMGNFESFIDTYGQDKSDPSNYYKVRIIADKGIDEVYENCETIISSYIPASDHSTSTDTIRQAMNEEQKRNENMLNYGIQIILIILALSNAYNSFHGNLISRKREFQLLSTAGMTDAQIKK
ncbi:hypothetical protein P261_02695 [Lachnospiraceae bacterium TWA4]|nr:hypothetical protein P261_02695 [Lachnospiraceae bacterium TWA4]